MVVLSTEGYTWVEHRHLQISLIKSTKAEHYLDIYE